MIISVCPKCYEKRKLVQGIPMKSVMNSNGVLCTVYLCSRCKEIYEESNVQ